ncbi:MAG: AMP-binding protein [Beijerinckiaceae bacterium]
MTIGAPVALFAQRKPDAPAIVCDDEIITWRELSGAVQTIAQGYEARNSAPGTVALILKNSPSFIAHFIACAITGREAAVIDATWPLQRIVETVRELAPALVYADDRLPAMEAIQVDPRARLPCGAAFVAERVVDPHSSFYVGFTSGSTGRPKGYRRSHHSWLTSFEGDRREFGVTENDVVLAPGSMTHSLFLYAAIHALQVGATIIMSRMFHPARTLRMARDYGATIAYGAPTQWRLLLDLKSEPLPKLRWVLSSGAKWFAHASDEVARLAPNAEFAEFYGASELSFVAVRKSGEACPETSVGRAFANVRIRIRDHLGRELRSGQSGRVFVESPYLFSGYATGDEPIMTHGAEMSVGDVGYVDDAGFLHLVGRHDRMIVTSGKNVFAEEIERALESAPGVRAAAAFGVADDLRGQKIVALVLQDGSRQLVRADIMYALRSVLPAPFLPRILGTCREWRWTASGKTDFKALRDQWDAGAWDELP